MVDKLWQIVSAAVKDSGGHDLSHVRRVHRLSVKIAANYPQCDKEILTAAVIMHDIARKEEDNDKKGLIDHAILGSQKTEQILLDLDWPAERAERASLCVRQHRYRGNDIPDSIEAKILYDADKLDSLGAVGVGRLFMLSGFYNEQIYIKPPVNFGKAGETPKIAEFKQYSPNLEYILKMRHIPDKLFTPEAKEMAVLKMERMARFFEELEEEIEG